MKRPERVIGHVTPWVDYADALEAELTALREAIKTHKTTFKVEKGSLWSASKWDVELWSLLQENK